MTKSRDLYASNATGERRAFIAPDLTLKRGDAAMNEHNLRDVFNAMRWIVRTEVPGRMMPHNFQRWEIVY